MFKLDWLPDSRAPRIIRRRCDEWLGIVQKVRNHLPWKYVSTSSETIHHVIYDKSTTIVAKSAGDDINDIAFEVFATDPKSSQFRKINKIIETRQFVISKLTHYTGIIELLYLTCDYKYDV